MTSDIPLTTGSEPPAAERLSWLIASWPAHLADLGPENEVLGDCVTPDPGQVLGEVPATLLRLAERVLSTVTEVAARACEDQALAFLSPLYTSQQPFGSFCERFACIECAKAIRALGNSDAVMTPAEAFCAPDVSDEVPGMNP